MTKISGNFQIEKYVMGNFQLYQLVRPRELSAYLAPKVHGNLILNLNYSQVFKLKGADRKHKQDREKIQKRPQSEQEKFQPSYECTIMNDISLDLVMPATTTGCYSPE